MYSLLRPLLFALPPEQAHALTLAFLHLLGKFGALDPESTDHSVRVAGLDFRNRVGIAAGFDKNGLAPLGSQRLGVGFVEVGTVTPLPQRGNAKPRVFRIKQDRALVNNLGFNGRGAEAMAARLSATRHLIHVPLGINVGPNQQTPLERAVLDYEAAMAVLARFADYFAINVSSPNTPGLRRLQASGWAEDLLGRLVEFRNALARDIGRRIPMFVKLSPDMSESEIRNLARTVTQSGCNGLIATNSTSARPVRDRRARTRPGGLSGKPLLSLSIACVETLRSEIGREFPIIGVGGIHDIESALSMRRAGADLLQLYTGLIYEGPGLLRTLSKKLAAR